MWLTYGHRRKGTGHEPTPDFRNEMPKKVSECKGIQDDRLLKQAGSRVKV